MKSALTRHLLRHLQRLRWQPGRARTGYQKWPIFVLPFADLYLIRYGEGHYLPPHRDVLWTFFDPTWWDTKHVRLNVVLREADEGGEFRCLGPCIWRTRRVVLFRPDKWEHQVTEVKRGERLVLSLGVAI